MKLHADAEDHRNRGRSRPPRARKLRGNVSDTDERPPDAPVPGTLVLRLHIEPGALPAGWIAVDGQADRPFGGWVGLLSAIGAARAEAHPAPAAPPPRLTGL